MISNPYNLLEGVDLTNKKGVIVVGTPRCGSHYVTDVLFNQYTIQNKVLVGEIPQTIDNPFPLWDNTTCDDILQLIASHTKQGFIFASLVTTAPKLILHPIKETLKDFLIVKLLRKDKIAQFRSNQVMIQTGMWLVAQHEVIPGQDSTVIHASPKEINHFLLNYHFLYACDSDITMIYEEVAALALPSSMTANTYAHHDPLDQFDNPEIVKTALSTLDSYDR